MDEPNLERRSGLAMENASAVLKSARQAYEKGDSSGLAAKIDEIRQSVDLAYESLQKTGKNPRKSPRWFKRAEIRTRDLGRELDGFQRVMSFNERPLLDKLREHVQQVHEDLLLGLLEGKGR